jgi:hypothetical protein
MHAEGSRRKPRGGGFGGGGGGGFGVRGGQPYGDLATQLIGGSGGSGGAYPGGGGGGGAIELGATGSLAIRWTPSSGTPSPIVAEGGRGGFGSAPGGSGGGIFLHADSVSLAGSNVLDVSGGAVFRGPPGGGRILILANAYSNSGSFNLAGGDGFNAGGAGVLTIIPEPSSLVLVGTGAVALLGTAARRRAKPRA